MQSVNLPPLRAICESHRGCVRDHNEDNFCYAAMPGGYLLCAVADGVGGHSGGDVASYLCCHRLLMDWKAFFAGNREVSETQMPRFLVEAINNANADIYRSNLEQHKRMPMCTTVAAAVFTPQMVIAAHVGDSRIYCRRNGELMQLTVDHTVLNELNERGLQPQSARYPGSNVISKAVGPQARIKPEIHTYFRDANDRYMLCTDGLTNNWNDDEMLDVLNKSSDAREATNTLLRETLRRGATDNVTLICVYPETE